MTRIPIPATIDAAPVASQPLLEAVEKHVALNTWTNYVNEVARTEIDFPVPAARKAA